MGTRGSLHGSLARGPGRAGARGPVTDCAGHGNTGLQIRLTGEGAGDLVGLHHGSVVDRHGTGGLVLRNRACNDPVLGQVTTLAPLLGPRVPLDDDEGRDKGGVGSFYYTDGHVLGEVLDGPRGQDDKGDDRKERGT